MDNFLVVVVWLGIINIATFAIFGYDKQQSIKGGWRVSEKNLFTLILIGGTAGALLGQKFFRHKTKKASFNAVLIVIMLVQLVIVATCFPEYIS